MKLKKLILTEKPSVAKDIARVLNCKQNVGGAIIGQNYVITWALGHLVTLMLPEELNKEWATWSMDTLPMVPKNFKTKVIPNTSKQFNVVKSWLTSNEISELIIATDAGREGELVARWIINKVGFNKPIKRLWISSMTDRAILDGFKNLADGKKYENLFFSAESRAIADWVVGLNVTRALTCKYNAQLSAGRVQTPTLAMIVEREEEINKFVPEEFYKLNLLIKGVNFTLFNGSNEKKFKSINDVNKIIDKIKNEVVIVSSVERKQKRELPPLLYSLTTLQQDANRIYGFSASLTLDLMQRLYENYKYLTYPRTDSTYLTKDMYDTIKERLLTIKSIKFVPIVKEILQKPLESSKRIFDDSKVSDHHAIILTEQPSNVDVLSPNELKIYELVTKRMLASFLTDYVYNQIVVTLKIGEYTFVAKGIEVIDNGWKKLYKKEELLAEDVSTIPSFNMGEKFNNLKPSIFKGLTKPKERYTEATLLYQMEHCGSKVEAKYQKILNDVSGIGTPATRAEIIERIFSAGYVELIGKSIYPTKKGIQLISLVPSALKSPKLTALYELDLLKIEKGLMKKTEFTNEIIKNTNDLINEIKAKEYTYKHDNATTKKCPNCGKTLLEVNNKFGKSLVCEDRNCGYRQNVSKNTNLMCPNCKRKLVEITSQNKLVLICKCGFKENKESFITKLNENKNQMNKQKLSAFLKHQEKEIPKNNPFEALFENIDK